jgi:hypothetical protein
MLYAVSKQNFVRRYIADTFCSRIQHIVLLGDLGRGHMIDDLIWLQRADRMKTV